MLLYDIFNGVVRCEITAPFEYQLSDVDALFIKQLCCCCGNMVLYKKKSTAVGFEEVIRKHDSMIIDTYELYETEDEIWVTEQVNNILFCKE